MEYLLLVLTASVLFCVSEGARSPAMFIFGDSLSDNGNNNYIPSIARANYLPYGIDFGMPTGRFCNGMTVMDYAAKYLGLQYPPPYLSLSSKTAEILRGVNYASAAAGILDETGQNYGIRIAFSGQIALFAKTLRLQLPELIPNSDQLYQYIANSLFVINIGSNDYINNYLLPKLYTSSLTYSGDEFAELLVHKFGEQIESLYRLGARKMILIGIGPLGCIPSQLSMNNSTGGCIDHINELVVAFNRRLVPLMTRLNSSLPGSFFVYDNIYDTFLDIFYNPSKYGFKVSNQACCGSGNYGGTLTCLPLQTPCATRDQYVFWDSFHPTQASNAIIAERSFGAAATDCYPISAAQLAEL
ncbi:GDSL esterase/lipase 7 [Typha angustifolia]|uniref:GDSL esterase/lipase 7 n=1 Tax=Typha angustifolia TaxID=59011 RepID=UPI003C2D4735